MSYIKVLSLNLKVPRVSLFYFVLHVLCSKGAMSLSFQRCHECRFLSRYCVILQVESTPIPEGAEYFVEYLKRCYRSGVLRSIRYIIKSWDGHHILGALRVITNGAIIFALLYTISSKFAIEY